MRHADVVAPLQTKFNDVIYIKGDAWVRCARYTDGGGERNVVVGLSNGEVKVTTMPPYTTEEGPMRQMDVEEEALPAPHTDEVLAMYVAILLQNEVEIIFSLARPRSRSLLCAPATRLVGRSSRADTRVLADMFCIAWILHHTCVVGKSLLIPEF